MTNILIICLEPIPSAIVGVLKPLKMQEQNCQIQVVFKKTYEVRKADLNNCDVLICVRGSEQIELKMVKSCREVGKYCIYYLDDDLLSVPLLAGSSDYFTSKEVADNIKNIISNCDCLWTNNPNINNKYGQFCGKVVITKGPALLLDNVQHYRRSNKIKIGFAGSTDYAKYIDTMLDKTLTKISHKYGERVSFEFLGAKPQLVKKLDNSEHFPYKNSPEEYERFMKSCNWDIGLAPLPEGPFFRCKYFNKFLEYGACGIAGVYSNVEPFTFIVENRVNGVLCENNEDAWTTALSELIEDIELRNKIATNAWKTLNSGFSVEMVGAEVLDKIPEIFDMSNSPRRLVRIFGLTPIQNKLSSWTARLRRLFKDKGIKAVFIIMKKLMQKVLRRIRE